MAHYDGPPFLRGEAETPAEKYPLPPKPKRQAPKPKPQATKPATKPTLDVGRHSVDPLAALSTPKSVIRRAVTQPQIDYRVILADMVRSDDQVYLFTDDTDASETISSDSQVAEPDLDAQSQNLEQPDEQAEAATPDSSDEVSASTIDTSSEDTTLQGDVSDITEAENVDVFDDVETDHQENPEVPSDVVESEQAEPNANLAAPATETTPVQVDEEESSEPEPVRLDNDQPTEARAADAVKPAATASNSVATKPKAAPTKLIPSQVDPLKAAQQEQLEAALAKQKKTVYANWRPLQLPKRNDLHSAVGDYKARHKNLPKPVAQVRAEQKVSHSNADQPKVEPAATTPQATAPTQVQSSAVAESSPDAKSTSVRVESSKTEAQSALNPDTLALHSETPPAQEPYVFPPLDLLPKPVITESPEQSDWVEAQSQRLDETLEAFHVGAQVVAHTIGPTVTQFQVSLDAGVKVNKITNLNDDLKLALAAKDIRIEAPIPGKTTVGIEIPNLHPRPVMLREVLQSPAFQEAESPLTIALGVDLFGQPVVTNINKMPHGLIAGATGSGKSVFINSLLTSLLYKATPEQVRLLLIDPKAVELAVYNNLPHLVSPVISDPKAAAEALKWAVEEMENRYQKMAAAGVRNLAQFNRKAKAHGDFGLVLPYVVIIIDELADLMMVAASEVQDYIARITQKARAAGIHLIVATQRPSVDVITGTIKNNIPTRIAFMVASQTDSRTIIDANGAERLLGRGDMLYLGSGASQALRLQGTFIDEDIATVVDFVKKERPAHYLFQPDGLLAQAEASDSQDELFPQVLEYIAQEKHVSTSKLQRVFSIGYNRAANLIDELEMRHYISPANGSKPRDVYFTKEDLADD